jgi:hypothetical protein
MMDNNRQPTFGHRQSDLAADSPSRAGDHGDRPIRASSTGHKQRERNRLRRILMSLDRQTCLGLSVVLFWCRCDSRR